MTRRWWMVLPLASCAKREVVMPEREMLRIVDMEKGMVTVEKMLRSPAEWRQVMKPTRYWVMREAGTEQPFTGEYDKYQGSGTFYCAGCGTAVFSGEHKFDSGTGWPSFWQPAAPQNVAKKVDGARVEVRCVRCDGHLGHVFDDGPPPTGLRYCINSISLTLTKSAL